MQARGAGRRDEWQNLSGGGCEQRPGGWRSAPGEEVGRDRYREGYGEKQLPMGGGRTEEGTENNTETVETVRVGRASIIVSH